MKLLGFLIIMLYLAQLITCFLFVITGIITTKKELKRGLSPLLYPMAIINSFRNLK